MIPVERQAVTRVARDWPLLAAKGTLLLWLGYFLIAPTIGFGWIDSWHNEQRAVQVILLAVTAIAFACVAWFRPESVIGTRSSMILIGAFLGIGALSAARSAYQFAGFAEVSLTGLLIALAALTAAVTRAEPETVGNWARYFALLFCTAYVLAVAVRLAAALSLGRGPDLDVLILGYANPRFPSAFHAALIPFVAAVAVDKAENNWLRGGAVAILAAIWAINWGLGTRGIWFAYLLGIPAAVLLLGWRRTKGSIAVLIATAVIGVVGFEFLRYATAGLESSAAAPPTANLTLTSREVLWHLSWDAIRSAPLLGIGPMGFAALGSHVGAHPHNWVLQIAAEYSLFALAMVSWLFWRFLALAYQAPLARDRAAIFAVVVALVLALVDGNLVMPVSQSAFALVAGLAIGYLCRPLKLPTFNVRLFATGACALSFCILPGYAIQSFRDQPGSVLDFRKQHGSAWLAPRFWNQGLLLRARDPDLPLIKR